MKGASSVRLTVMKQRTVITAFLVCLILFVPAFACAATDDLEPVLLSVVQDYGRPLSFLDAQTGAISGFQVEIMNVLAKKAGLKVKHVFVPTYAELVMKFENENAALTPSVAISDERKKIFDFTEPYESIPLLIFVRSDDVKIQELAPGMIVGAVRASAAVGYLRKTEGISIELYPGYQEVITALLELRIDAFTASAERVRGMLKDAGIETKIKTVGHPVGVVRRAIAVRKGDLNLVQRLNKEITIFVGSSEYRKIHEKWFGMEEK